MGGCVCQSERAREEGRRAQPAQPTQRDRTTSFRKQEERERQRETERECVCERARAQREEVAGADGACPVHSRGPPPVTGATAQLTPRLASSLAPHPPPRPSSSSRRASHGGRHRLRAVGRQVPPAGHPERGLSYPEARCGFPGDFRGWPPASSEEAPHAEQEDAGCAAPPFCQKQPRQSKGRRGR